MKTKSINIIGRRWFQKSYGNTYNTAEIFINGKLAHKTDVQYGYDDHYLTIAEKWLVNNKHVKESTSHLRYQCEDNGIEFSYQAIDVPCQKDL